MKHTMGWVLGGLIGVMVSFPVQGDPPRPSDDVPAERTITATLKPVRPKRVAELHYNDALGRICVDSWQIEANRLEIYVGDNVVFRVRSTRRCDDKSEKSPPVERAVWSVRTVQGKKIASDKAETLLPQSSSFSFSHAFPAPGTYAVTVQNRVNELEVHTVSVNVLVTERPAYAVEPKIAE